MPSKPPPSSSPAPGQPLGLRHPSAPYYCAKCAKTQPHTLGPKRADFVVSMTCTVCGWVSFKVPGPF